MWLKSAILFAVLSGGIAAADAAPVYHCDSGSSRVYTSEPQPDCREQAALPKISAYTASQTKAAPRKAAASKKQTRKSPAKKSQSKPTRQAAKPKAASTPKKTSEKGRGHKGFPAALPSTKPAP